MAVVVRCPDDDDNKKFSKGTGDSQPPDMPDHSKPEDEGDGR